MLSELLQELAVEFNAMSDTGMELTPEGTAIMAAAFQDMAGMAKAMECGDARPFSIPEGGNVLRMRPHL